jgi:3-deoxy-D-manno-octulosonic-acid transferase
LRHQTLIRPHDPIPERREPNRPLAGRTWAAAATALAPLLPWHLRARARRQKEIAARLPERQGIDPTPRPPGRLVWMHAASVGETMSILPVLPGLTPHATVLLTTGTVTAARLLDQRLPNLCEPGRVLQRFAPLDVPAWADRFLDHWQPDVAVFVESELWPNQLHACRARAIPLMLLNARMSAGSFATWRRLPGFARHVLEGFTTVWARGEEDATRFRILGAPRVEIAGDLKFAAPPLPCDPTALAGLRRDLAGRPIWVAASTHPGEEAAIAALHPRIAARHPGLLTIIVPRHPERGAALAATLRCPARTAGAPPPPQGIWLADTLGELGLWYRLAPVVFVGRSLFPPGGGQNPLEPARLGGAIAVGPHTGNFAEHVALLRGEDAARDVADPAALGDFVATMLARPEDARAMGARATRLAARFQELPAQAAATILGQMIRAGGV